MGRLAIKQTQSLGSFMRSRSCEVVAQRSGGGGAGGVVETVHTVLHSSILIRGINAFRKGVGLFNLSSDFFGKVQNFPIYELDGLQLFLETQHQLLQFWDVRHTVGEYCIGLIQHSGDWALVPSSNLLSGQTFRHFDLKFSVLQYGGRLDYW